MVTVEIDKNLFCDCKKAILQIDEENDIYRIEFLGMDNKIYYKNNIKMCELIRYFENLI